MKSLLAIALGLAAATAAPAAYAQLNGGQGNAMRADADQRAEHGDATVTRRTVVTHRTTTTHEVAGMRHHRHCRTVWRHHKRVRVCR